MKIDDSIALEFNRINEWSEKNSKRFSPFDFVFLAGNIELLVSYSSLFNPHIVTHRGGIYLADRFDEYIYDLWVEKGYGEREIQRVMNHLHIQSMSQGDNYSPRVLGFAANTLAEVWRKTLPKEASVEVVGLGSEDVAVTFWTCKDAPLAAEAAQDS